MADTIHAHETPVQSLELSRNGRYLLTCGLRDPVIRLWKLADGRGIASFDVNSVQGAQHILLDAKDERFVASGVGLQLWDILTGKRLQQWITRGHATAEMGKLTQSCYAGDGIVFASGVDGTCKAFDTRQRMVSPVVEWNASSDALNCIVYSNYRVIAGGNDGRLYTYDIRQAQLCTDTFDMRSAVMSISAIEDAAFVSMLGKEEVCLYNVKTAQVEERYKVPKVENYMVNLQCNGNTLAVGSESGLISLFPLSSIGSSKKLELEKRGTGRVVKVALNKTGTLAAGCGDGQCHVFRTSDE